MAGALPARSEMQSATPREAFEKGMAAYRVRDFDVAVPALEIAAQQGDLFATFYLARIYSDTARPFTDEGRAYRLYSQIVDRFYAIDPKDFRRAPTVAKSITAMARYVYSGLPEISLAPDRAYALRLYRYAAQYYNEPDAQFELAKLQLVGDGVRQDVRSALYWFSRLVKRGHPSAQAFLADLLWRGKYLKPDPVQALALVTIARRNAPQHELIWIDDIYQNVYCGSSSETRSQVRKKLAEANSQTLRPWVPNDPASLGWLTGPTRVCSDGTEVAFPDVPEMPTASLAKNSEPEGNRSGKSQGNVTDVKSTLMLGITTPSTKSQ